MRALICRQFGPPSSLRVEDVPAPLPKAGEVIVAVEAAGVNFPDLLMIEGKYQRIPPFPFAPGCEAAGTIKRLGAGVIGWNVGDRVMTFVGHDTFAEEVAVDATQLSKLPGTFDAITGAAFMLTYGTALHGLADRGNLQSGETLLVLGAAGGVGSAAIEVGKVFGARVIAAASSDEKLAFCKSIGADETINYSREDFRERVKQLTGGRGVDVAFDPVGGSLAEPTVRAMARGGRYLVVGFAQGEIPKIPLNLPLLKNCAIVGVTWGSFVLNGDPGAEHHLRQLAALAAEGRLNPRVTKVYGLNEAAQALDDMAQRRVTGKVVIDLSR